MIYENEQHHQQQPLTYNKRRGGVKKVVSFNPNGRVRLIPSNACYSSSQKRDMYYNQADYLSMKCSRTMIIAQLVRNRRKNGNSIDDDNFCCSLGLYTPNEQLQRQQRIYTAREAVFEEQELQWEEQVVDEELLADVYFETTKECQIDAYLRGTQLEHELQYCNKKTSSSTSSIFEGEARKQQEQQEQEHHLESINNTKVFKNQKSISMIRTSSNKKEEQYEKKIDVSANAVIAVVGDKRKFVFPTTTTTTSSRGKRNPTLMPSKRSRSM